MPLDQSDGVNFSVEVPYSHVTLVYAKLTRVTGTIISLHKMCLSCTSDINELQVQV